MNFSNHEAEVFIPDSTNIDTALARTSHLAIAAHQDDLEILAMPAIIDCFQNAAKWFTGVVVTDGRGSPRNGFYEKYSDEEMRLVRVKEQKKAAVVGEYSAQILLDHSSSSVKNSANNAVLNDIQFVIEKCKPNIVFTHNLADKHDTHVAVVLRTIAAIRNLPREARPSKLFGCEVWRDLDWLCDAEKCAMSCSAHENIQAALVGLFDSQITGGKRYDLATSGRRRAHATFSTSHGTDKEQGLLFAMDLSELILDTAIDPADFTLSAIDRFRKDVEQRIRRFT